jgi:lysophospholipase L1-like esterase
MGDSISAGYDASAFLGVPPRQPAYPALVAAALERTYQSRVFLSNVAVPGWQASQGVTQVTKTSIVDTQPDLVIVAYGMNDVSEHDAVDYGKQIASILQAFRQKSPDTEFILVAPMFGNSRWAPTPPDQFVLYRDQLKALCGPGVYLADITAIWPYLLTRKTFFDLTGNGLNHPNDFTQRLYAQVIAAALIREKK